MPCYHRTHLQFTRNKTCRLPSSFNLKVCSPYKTSKGHLFTTKSMTSFIFLCSLNNFHSFFSVYTKESHKRDSPPAAGRISGIIPLRRSAVPKRDFLIINCIYETLTAAPGDSPSVISGLPAEVPDLHSGILILWSAMQVPAEGIGSGLTSVLLLD